MKKGSENLTVQRQPTRNSDGDKTPGEVVGILRRCIVMPRASTERAERGITSIAGFTVWAPEPITIEVRATDVIVVRGFEHGIDGVPGDWRKGKRKMGLLFQTVHYGVTGSMPDAALAAPEQQARLEWSYGPEPVDV